MLILIPMLAVWLREPPIWWKWRINTLAQEVLGKVHRNTGPARAMLEQEGFEFKGMVDIFDGGPCVHANTSQIRVIRDNQDCYVEQIETSVDDGSQMIMANTNLDFRCCLGQVSCVGNAATISEVTALRLDLKKGDRLRLAHIKPSS